MGDTVPEIAVDSDKSVLRFAVAMRGGVSLAVWIGGAFGELDRVSRPKDESRDPFVHALLAATEFRDVEIDILTGASAGGLNAAIGGLALASGTELNLRDVWIKTADLDQLLTIRDGKRRASLLDGDYFREQVIERLENLRHSPRAGDESHRRSVEMFLAATVLGGVPVTDRVDPLFSDRRHEAFFHFRHLADSPAFSDVVSPDAPHHLGIAARSSASFPAAFEPVKVASATYEGEIGLPPVETVPPSLQLFDGGVVDNIPVTRAIRAAAAAPASEQVRRWVVFLHPSPTVFATPPTVTPTGAPSVLSVVADVVSSHGAETLLDDLETLEAHNRESQSQRVKRYSLCQAALANVQLISSSALASVDASCLYELLDEPAKMLAWIPIGSSVPPSPIHDLDDDDRYTLRRDYLAALVQQSGTVRPFAQLARLAHLAIEWIRWAELHTTKELSEQRLVAYDVLLVAQLVDSVLGCRFLDSPDDRLATLQQALAHLERDSSLHSLVNALGSGSTPTGTLFDRVGPGERDTLVMLATGEMPNGHSDLGFGTSRLMLDKLSRVCLDLYNLGINTSGMTPSIFTLLVPAVATEPSLAHVKACLLAMDVACAGIHRGCPVGVPQTLDYMRISGAAPSPLANADFAPDELPKFSDITVDDHGKIDPAQKLAGNKLMNFSAFVSPRFRANDWMWGRMDAAAGLVDILVRPEYLPPHSTVETLLPIFEQVVTAPFGEGSAGNGHAAAALDLCKALWKENREDVRVELSQAIAVDAAHETGVRGLELTRNLVLTRWHLELFVTEVSDVLAQPLEPGDPPGRDRPPDPSSDPAAVESDPKARVQALMTAYEKSPRKVGDIWGRRKTTALGVLVADRATRALVPGPGPLANIGRVALGSPLFVVAAAMLSRGAFLLAWNALVNVVLLPRLTATARIATLAVTFVLSALFWLKLVKRKKSARSWFTLVVWLAFAAFGVVTIFWDHWPFRPPDRVAAATPWDALTSHWSLLWPGLIVGAASGFAAACLWIWAKRRWIVVVSVITTVVMGWWTIVGAWQRSSKPSVVARAFAGAGSLWIPALSLAAICTWITLVFSPEDRGPKEPPDDGGPTMPATEVESAREPAPELRVHGVGGSPGPHLLGYDDLAYTAVVKTIGPIVVRRRLDDPDGMVAGFDWGNLTSGAAKQALWVFLLPFTLLNAAGWAHPPEDAETYPNQRRITQAIVIVLGWLLTATTALWVSDLLIEYAGYQWVPRAIGDHPRVVPLLPFGWWHLSLTATAVRGVAVGVAAALAFGLLLLVAIVAGRSKTKSNEPDRTKPAFTVGAHPFDNDFFDRRASWAASVSMHLVVAALAIGVALTQAIVALCATPKPRRAGIDVSLLMVGGLQLALLVVFAIVLCVIPVVLRKRAAGVAWAGAALSFALINAFFSGLTLWVTRYLAIHPKLTGSTDLRLGRELAVADAFVLVAVVWALIGVGLMLRRGKIQGEPAQCDPAEPIPAHMKHQVANAQGAARIVHRMDRLLVALATVFVVLGIAMAWHRVHVAAAAPWHWKVDLPAPKGIAYVAAAWALPWFAVFVAARARQAASDNRTRRFIGQVWDVLSFWPRRFHPFAVRPYSHIAVPALQAEIQGRLEDHGSVVVSAHSQGTILSAAALSAMPNVERVGLVTYGSHIATLYRQAFPAYFSPAQVASLHAQLSDSAGERWHNFYRFTDPIGGPMFAGTAAASCDHCLADPAVTAVPLPPPGEPPLEHDRQPGNDLAIHSYYLTEPKLKECVAALRRFVA